MGFVEDILRIVFLLQNLAVSLLMVYLPWLRATGDCKAEHNDTHYSLVVGRSLHGTQEKGQITSSPKDSPQQRGGVSVAQATCIKLAHLQRCSFICFPKDCILFSFVFPSKIHYEPFYTGGHKGIGNI